MDIPSHMNAMVLTGHGGLDKLVHARVPVPALGDDDVLIKVAACGVNNTDINTRTGWYAPSIKTGLTEDIGLNGVPASAADLGSWDRSTLQFPRIQGADAVGRIVAVGRNVPATRIGTRVMTDPCIRDPERPLLSQGVLYFGSECDGGYADYTRIPAVNAMEVNCTLTDVELASFACSYSTAEEMLVRIDLRKDETVLVTGASGGVGSALVQLARRR
jgi:NADPH:quinone reductase-like Zn-dependent oxidoreductase